MNRLFGAKKNALPKPTLNDAISNIDTRVSSLDVKLTKVNSELATYQQRLARMREGPGKKALKQKALKLLKQKKQYESQKDQLETQSWNMSQAQMTNDNLKNTMVTIDAMKLTNKELKRTYGKIDVDKIDDLQDEMLDLIEKSNEIQNSLSTAYNMPDDVSESELDAELEALGEEIQYEQETNSQIPSYLQMDDESTKLPSFIDDDPIGNSKLTNDKLTAS